MSKTNTSSTTISLKHILNTISYEQFQLEILEELKAMLDDEYTVELRQVIRNNSVELVVIAIREAKNSIAPNIYLDLYYEKYLEGYKITELAQLIVDSYFDYYEDERIDINILDFRWERVRDRVFYRVINRDKNLKLLQQVPHLLYLDLAITFHCLMTKSENNIGTMRVTKDHMKTWGIKLKDLRDMAIINTPRLFPASIRNMNDVILDILNKDWINGSNQNSMSSISDELSEEMIADMVIKSENDDNIMYVMSNSRGIGGATCLLYKELLYEFANEIDSNLFILPSSIHEVLIVKDDGYVDKEDLREMVIGVNETEVEEEDFLSNQIYHYNRFSNMITM